MKTRTSFTLLFLIALADVARAGQLHPGQPAAPAEVNLAAGRTTRVPVSWSFKTSFRRTGPHQLVARGRCFSGNAALLIDVFDLETHRPAGTFFNDGNQGDEAHVPRTVAKACAARACDRVRQWRHRRAITGRG